MEFDPEKLHIGHSLVELFREHPIAFSFALVAFGFVAALVAIIRPSFFSGLRAFQSRRGFSLGVVAVFGLASGILRLAILLGIIAILVLLSLPQKTQFTLGFYEVALCVFVVGLSKLQAMCLLKPSWQQTTVTLLFHYLGFGLAIYLINMITDYKIGFRVFDGWSAHEVIQHAVSILGLTFGWRIPPSSLED